MFAVESMFSFFLSNSYRLMFTVSFLIHLCKDLRCSGFSAAWQNDVQKGCLSLELEVTAGADLLCDVLPSS